MPYYASTPGALPWQGWYGAAARAGRVVLDQDFSLRCAGVAFYGLMSVFPAMGLAVLVYGLGMDQATLQQHLEVARPLMPADVFLLLQERLEDVVGRSNETLGIGALVAFGIILWSSSRGMSSMIVLLGATYQERDDRSFMRSTAIAIGLTIGAILFTLLAVTVIATIPLIKQVATVDVIMERVVQLVSWLVMALFAFIAITGLYRLAPHRRDASLAWLVPGAAFATAGWLIGSLLFSIYVENFSNYGATFGSLTAAIVLMLWMYYSVLIVAFGGALNANLELLTRMDTTVGPNRPMGERGAFVADHTVDRLKTDI
jgi:membrane protein